MASAHVGGAAVQQPVRGASRRAVQRLVEGIDRQGGPRPAHWPEA
ncbi:hypothetical protein [Nonomuraea typhae]|uniref:Uncharacterized protein n=1 Tax=Nonomuraea typhae TaxID=2603600 RepID=A0ABW7YQQ0_9ACTN